MRALIFDGTLHLEGHVPIPRASRGEALIRVQRAGICGTDLEIIRGYKRYHGILGHEFVGIVVESHAAEWTNRRVCGEINVSCGLCDMCRSGLSAHCRHRSVIGMLGHPGAFADYLTVPVQNLHAVPPSVSTDDAVFVEPLAAAFEILEQIDIGPADRVVVLGDGRLGNLCAQAIASAGVDVLSVGRHTRKLDILSGLGIRTAMADEDLPEADIVVEATGSPSGLDVALRVLRPRGTLVLKSTVAGTSEVDLSRIVVKELRVIGSRCGPFVRAIDALATGAVQVAPLVEAQYSLDKGVAAIHRAAAPGVLKVLLAMDT